MVDTSLLHDDEIRHIGTQRKLLDVRCPVMVVSPWAVVLSTNPIAVLDLAGGCCRPVPPVSLQHSQITNYVRRPRQGVDTEYEWLFLACHSHSSTYFHAMGEAATKLMWALRLLHENPRLRVLHASGFVEALLPILNLTGRGVLYNGKSQFARRITLPPSAHMQSGLITALRRTMFAHLKMTIPKAVTDYSDGAVIVVRRSATAKGGGRALLNHDELMLTLRFALLTTKTTLLEWPPEGRTLAQTVATWRTATAVVAPHGAGLTNMIFMPRGSRVVEIFRDGNALPLYKQLADMMRLEYTACPTRENGLLKLSSPPSIQKRLGHTTGFSLNLTYFIDQCMRQVTVASRVASKP